MPPTTARSGACTSWARTRRCRTPISSTRARPWPGPSTSWERLERDSSVTDPCENEGDPGQPVVFQTHFPTATGRAKFVPADLIGAAERPDRDYPMVLITGRQLEHWHTGAITRRSGVLDAIEPEPVASLHPLDLAALGAKPGELVTVESRRGKIALYARADAGTPRGAVFIPFC